MQAQEQEQARAPTLWYKDAVIYELHVRAFCDGNGDGVGDFRGLISKLDYLKELGVTAVWLLPFYKSPLKDDGYDVSDHRAVNPDLGSMGDFRKFVKEAHKRGLKVITELILNHTSSEHPWFQRARTSPPGSPWRDYYTWSETDSKFREARVIFSDYETSNWSWDPVAKAYYWHRFFSHQPDLNYDNPAVQEEALRTADFWLALGVDGLRLDGVAYLFEREGTNCESLPETHAFLKKLRAHVDSKFEDRMLLAEANQWPADAVDFFGDGDECQMAFHFPLMPRMFMSLQLGDKTPIVNIVENTPAIPESCQWALFLRNHDELTLEMVTDEERDYLFRSYAREGTGRVNLGIRRRLAPLLANDRRSVELLNLLLFTLPGTPVVYYGDEILMGDNPNLGDRNSVRTPMQWDSTMNAGFSTANPQRLYLPLVTDPEFNYETVNVENQEKNPSSHIWWLKKLITVRKNLKALSRGGLYFVDTGNPRVLAFVRSYGEEAILVVANLSDDAQAASLDLSPLAGRTPVDIFGATRFPPVAQSSYHLTFGPRGSFAFDVSGGREKSVAASGLPDIQLRRGVSDAVKGGALEAMESKGIPMHLSGSPWFRGGRRRVEVVKVRDAVPVTGGSPGEGYLLTLADVYYREGMPETYFLPLAYAGGEGAKRIMADSPGSCVATASLGDEKGVVYDPAGDERFRSRILGLRRPAKSERGEFKLSLRGGGVPMADGGEPSARSRSYEGDPGGSFVHNERLLVKLIRNPEEGVNPELEVGDLLTAGGFPWIRKTVGDITYTEKGAGPLTVAILYEYAPADAGLWGASVEEAKAFLARTAKGPPAPRGVLDVPVSELARSKTPQSATRSVGPAPLKRMAELGRVTASFHGALAAGGEGFAPQPLGYLYQVSVSFALSTKARRLMAQARGSPSLPRPVLAGLRALADSEGRLLGKLEEFRVALIDSVRTRIHGSYGLERVVEGPEGMKIIDCESGGSESIEARRILRSPLRDVARMVRSVHRAAHSAFKEAAAASPRPDLVEEWAYLWYKVCSAAFVRSYVESASKTKLVPVGEKALGVLLDTCLIEECLDELGGCLDSHPEDGMVPLRALMEILAR